ncbi:MAG TPA: DUF6659 family protein [Nitrososphaera sp.]|nr:DUF6659 family protein [Nitrososphaera sp.]
MQQPSLCDRIINLDRTIRFVGIVNNKGEVIEGGFKGRVEPLLNETDEQQMYIQSLSNLTALQSYSEGLGKVLYSLTEHEKVTLITFPLGDGILCVSATPKADMNKMRDKIMNVLKSINRSKPPRKKRNKQIKNRREY